MICPHCKSKVRSISYNCSVCGGYLYEKVTENQKPVDEQKYIRNKLVEFGLNKYKNKEDISEEEISMKDELFLRLKVMEIARENNEVMKRQENHLRIIKNILIFFTIAAILVGVFSVIANKKMSDELSKYLYSYEQNIGFEKYL